MSKPKILYYDIETSPILAWTWRIGQNINISHDQIYQHSPFGIICVCYKWAGDSKIHSIDWGLKEQDTEKLIKKFDKIYSQADIAIGHNGDNFDAKHINTHRLINRLDPVSWVQSEDTLKQVRKHFKLPSNKLDYLSHVLLGEGKAPMGFQDWIDIVQHKKKKALDKMIKYCKRDVHLLEKVENIIAPYVEHKVNKSILKNGHKDGCPSCGEFDNQRYGFYTSRTGKYQKYKCNNCAHIWKDGSMIKLEKQ